MSETALEIAAACAPWIVEHGLDYASARRKATENLGLHGLRGVQQPDDLMVEDAVREHIALFGAEEQARELEALRRLALEWMQRLAAYSPHVAGAVWRGTATRHSPILIDLYSDDPTAPEIELHNQGVRFDTGQRPGRGHDRGRQAVPVIGLAVRCPAWPDRVPMELSVWPADDLRGALKPDARGHSWRGSLQSLARLLHSGASS